MNGPVCPFFAEVARLLSVETNLRDLGWCFVSVLKQLQAVAKQKEPGLNTKHGCFAGVGKGERKEGNSSNEY